MGRARKLGSFALAWLLVAGITLGGLELVSRLIDPLGVSYYPETARWLDTLLVEEGVGYRNRPGVSGTFYGAPVRINSLGLRGPEIPAKRPGEFRILLMGDSFPFGIGVSEDQAFPAVLGKLLDREAGRAGKYRVINMGVVSYNTVQELRQLRELGLSLQPDAVVLGFGPNDIEPVMWVFEKRRSFVVDLVQRSYAGSLVAILTRNIKSKLFDARAGSLAEYREDSRRWQEIARSLSEMNALCRRAGIPFLLFHDREDQVAMRALLAQVAAREGFPVLELFRSRHPRWRARDPRSLVNSAMDGHPNVEGNVMYAELLRDALRGRLD